MNLKYIGNYLYLPDKFEANHNKDYSVVKTFKPPSSYNTGALFYTHHLHVSIVATYRRLRGWVLNPVTLIITTFELTKLFFIVHRLTA